MLDFGVMGEVYLVQHPRLARQDVLRVLPAAMTADLGFCQRFMREADVAARLYHPNILEMYDRGEFEGRLWITTEYVTGTTAEQLLADRYPSGMPTGEVFAIIAVVAGALDYAHQRGLLHRDVKPANILLTGPQDGEQRILLTNLGLARYLGDGTGAAAGSLAGETVAYAAPELMTDRGIDGRIDQYGLAATAFHLLAGAPPYQTSSSVAVGQPLSAAPPNISDRRPELASLDEVLAIALAKNPADRFARCREFADALIERGGGWIDDRSPESVLAVLDYPDDAEAETASSESGGQRPSVPGKRRWPLFLLGAGTGAVAVLLGVLLVVGIAMERRSNSGSTQAASPPSRLPAAAPSSSRAANPGPGQQLEGAYQVDVNRSQQTYNDNPDPQPPDVSTWWAFRSSCTPAGCVAAGIMLDNNNHLVASASGGDHPLVLDYRDGSWQSRPESVQFPCVGPSGTAGKQTTKQVLSLQPHGNGPLRGVMTVNVETDECGQKGAQIVIPAVAGRVGDVPPGVKVPEPPTSAQTSAAPTTTTPTR